MIEISIITINYNGLNDTCALIETIPNNDNLEVIVVDNASNNQEAEADTISKKYPHVKVIKSEKNLGFAGGNNLGIKAAQGKYLFFINNDTIFKDFNVQVLIDRLESSPAIGVVCPKIRFAWGNNPIQFTGYTPLSKITVRNQSIGFGEEDQGQYDSPHPTPYAHGAAMLIKREAINKTGLMPECFFLYYEELSHELVIKSGMSPNARYTTKKVSQLAKTVRCVHTTSFVTGCCWLKGIGMDFPNISRMLTS